MKEILSIEINEKEDINLPLDESKTYMKEYTIDKDSILYKISERKGYLRHINLIAKKQLLNGKNLKFYSSQLLKEAVISKPSKLNTAYNSLFDNQIFINGKIIIMIIYAYVLI